jgi:DNA-binding response OmpR family regulator
MTPTVLIVDDEHDLATTCQRLLRRRGWNVVIANGREAALTILAELPRLALLIVDRQLPDGDGLEILRAARGQGTPVIVATGYGSAATRRLALDEGAAGFLAKPFSADDLLDLVRTVAGDAPPVAP